MFIENTVDIICDGWWGWGWGVGHIWTFLFKCGILEIEKNATNQFLVIT